MLKKITAPICLCVFMTVPGLAMAQSGCEMEAKQLLQEATAEQEQVVDEKGEVVVKMKNGEETDLSEEQQPAEPRENWFGNNPANEAAVETLENAIDLAEQGKEKECSEMLADAKDMLSEEAAEESVEGDMAKSEENGMSNDDSTSSTGGAATMSQESNTTGKTTN
ncbi:hypothetical protein ACKTEK_07165 [Tepidamorphus sp. 3E244]|uniref:hypothetical protein n=1 Tax=Tepidamorphus sp. 3E244 TaxID=3385498 RepID=UPI0038FC4DB7